MHARKKASMIMNIINLSSNSNDQHPSTPPLLLPFSSFQPPLINTFNNNYNYHYNNIHNLMPISTTTTTSTTTTIDHDPYCTANAFGSVSSIGLNLGQRTYFSSGDHATVINRLFSRSRPGVYNSNQQPAPRCQAEGCCSDLSMAKHYHRRHKVCEFHSKATIVIAAGLQQRFCQQCSRFHVLSEFDESKRSCRKRLADHNRRRRKPQPQPQKNKQVMIMSSSTNRRSMEGDRKFEFEFECSNLYQNQVPYNFVVSEHDEQPNMSLLHHDHNNNLFCSTSIAEHLEQQQQQQHNHQEAMFEVEFM